MLDHGADTPVAAVVQGEAARTAAELSRIAWRERRAEWGGIAWGRIYTSRGRPVVWLAAMTPGVGRATRVAYVMLPESYVIGARMLRDAGFPPGLEELGSWHSHPGFGSFMSSVDEDYFRLCFPRPWQVTCVLDPLNEDYGIYVKAHGGTVRIPALVYEGHRLDRIPRLDARTAWRATGGLRS